MQGGSTARRGEGLHQHQQYNRVGETSGPVTQGEVICPRCLRHPHPWLEQGRSEGSQGGQLGGDVCEEVRKHWGVLVWGTQVKVAEALGPAHPASAMPPPPRSCRAVIPSWVLRHFGLPWDPFRGDA